MTQTATAKTDAAVSEARNYHRILVERLNQPKARYQSFPPSSVAGQWVAIGYHGKYGVYGVGDSEQQALEDAKWQMARRISNDDA